jgi:hypothetical protein
MSAASEVDVLTGDAVSGLKTLGPVQLSVGLRRLLIDQFSADALRHLAALKESGAPGAQARRRLGADSIEELAEMLRSGRKPTVGWWQRHAA